LEWLGPQLLEVFLSPLETETWSSNHAASATPYP